MRKIMEEELKRIFMKKNFDKGLSKLSNDDIFFEHGMDSLQFVEFLSEIEAKYKFLFDVVDLDIDNLNTISKVSCFIKKRLEEKIG